MSKVLFSAVFDDDGTNNMAPCQSYGHLKTCLFQQFYFSAAQNNENEGREVLRKRQQHYFFHSDSIFDQQRTCFCFEEPSFLPSTCKKKFLRPKKFSFTVTHLKIKLKTNQTSLT